MLRALVLAASCCWAAELNDRPIVGILAQHYHGGPPTFIAASYVKFVESAGARVAPIFVDREWGYYAKLFRSINGLLLPGGGASLRTSGYSEAAKILLSLALKEYESNGTHFPVWGTCLGMEELVYLRAGESIMKACSGRDLATSLSFGPDFRRRGLFNRLPHDLERALRRWNVTYNFHQWCITPENWTRYGLDAFYEILSTSRDRNGLQFVSTMQAKRQPIFATQWHPEKALFEWVNGAGHRNLPHSEAAVRAAQYVANFFVSQARRNLHRFSSAEEEARALIYNYEVTYMGPGAPNVQEYIFG